MHVYGQGRGGECTKVEERVWSGRMIQHLLGIGSHFVHGSTKMASRDVRNEIRQDTQQGYHKRKSRSTGKKRTMNEDYDKGEDPG